MPPLLPPLQTCPSVRGKLPPAPGTNTPAVDWSSRPNFHLATAATERQGEQDFTLVTRSNKGKTKQGTGKTTTEASPAQPLQINITPASYASTAAAAAGRQQHTLPANQSTTLPTITEVTVLRTVGHNDSQVER